MRRLKAALCIMLALTLLCCTGASAVSVKKGQSGFEPYILNIRLNELGYDTDRDSSQFDDAAVKAVRSFQEQNGLKATGTVDDATWEALFNESYTLSFTDGINHRDYKARGKLVVPFASLETKD